MLDYNANGTVLARTPELFCRALYVESEPISSTVGLHSSQCYNAALICCWTNAHSIWSVFAGRLLLPVGVPMAVDPSFCEWDMNES